MADYSYGGGAQFDVEAVPLGFGAVGHVTADEPIVSSADEGDDKPLLPWQARTIRTMQARREVSFSLQFPRQQQPRPPLWLLQLLGVTVTPAPPTVREAVVDVWDALRVLFAVIFRALRDALRETGDRVADRWYDALYGALDRWDVLRGWKWRRQLVGPVVRFWTVGFTFVGVAPRRVETWAEWRRRQAGLPLAVWRG
ncbi:hypothetical protein I5G97_gp015 [Mycobacterium phage Curiosium]|uniref:Uncharacterized protein n=1 Tax=Mycobacterium phage Curiosium TaxID=2599859 RepID=A0A5J6TUV4_9CAUD|nr:hypothetical protein I5G97_gp015 [Mycobacterium phage Curiosium]QFG14138.1 hypothetical protein PBI_CURIOSIUM_95 [Mycobacterium phage Curiosium]